jgi:hypothetical protein
MGGSKVRKDETNAGGMLSHFLCVPMFSITVVLRKPSSLECNVGNPNASATTASIAVSSLEDTPNL